MRVCLAGPYSEREQLRAYGEELQRIGFTIASTWLQEEHEISPGVLGPAAELSDEQVDEHAMTDLLDIQRCDLLVLFTAPSVGLAPEQNTSGGRHVETGYALALGKRVVVVGEPENVFHRLLSVTVVPDWHEAVLELSHRLVRATADRDIVAAPVG
jgi:nucleoside 2-deoxyribosyltransferase